MRWLGTLNFEERSVGVLHDLKQLHLEYGIKFEPLSVYRYVINYRPEEEAADRFREHQQLFEQCAVDLETSVDFQDLDSRAYYPMVNVLQPLLHSESVDLTIVDLSSFNKLHAVACGCVIGTHARPGSWAFTYTSPENYGSPTRDGGWRDMIVASLSEPASLLNEAGSRGVVLLGHETDRLLISMAEVEPAGGVFVVPKVASRPDLQALMESRNALLLSQMLGSSPRDWSKEVIRLEDTAGLAAVVQKEVNAAESYDAPIFLFPYGPKPMVALAAMQLSMTYPGASWFVYPVAIAYNTHYTEGIGQTNWYLASDRTGSTWRNQQAAVL